MTKWEYCRIFLAAGAEDSSIDIQFFGWNKSTSGLPDAVPATLNDVIAYLGLQGWELVNVVATTRDDEDWLEYYFKRPVTAQG